MGAVSIRLMPRSIALRQVATAISSGTAPHSSPPMAQVPRPIRDTRTPAIVCVSMHIILALIRNVGCYFKRREFRFLATSIATENTGHSIAQAFSINSSALGGHGRASGARAGRSALYYRRPRHARQQALGDQSGLERQPQSRPIVLSATEHRCELPLGQ